MSFELLADHLEPRFGNIYDEYNVKETPEGYATQEWTDGLKAAVKQYLLHELPAGVFEMLVDGDVGPGFEKEAQVDEMIERDDPGELGYAVRNAAVRAVPTFDQLIGHLQTWQNDDQKEDAAIWLDAHASAEELAKVVQRTNFKLPMGMLPREPDAFDLAFGLRPLELLEAWRGEVGSVASDLTGAEWELLVSLLPPRRQAGLGPRSVHPDATRRSPCRRGPHHRFPMIRTVTMGAQVRPGQRVPLSTPDAGVLCVVTMSGWDYPHPGHSDRRTLWL